MKSKLLYGFVLGLLTLFMLFSGCINASAENNTYTTIIMTIDNTVMQINGEDVNIDENGTSPIISNGRTLVPIRAVAEKLGGSVEWDNDTRTVSITKDSKVIKLVIDEVNAIVDESNVALDTAPVIMNGRTMLRLRFVAESLGADVEWNSEKREITIKSDNNTDLTETITEGTSSELTTKSATDNKNLIVYFTLPETDGVDTVAGASRVVVDDELYGNIEFMANTIRKTVGGDIFEIKTVQSYPTIHKPLVDLADEELENNARPELSTHIDNLDDYDTIFVGYPIWWGDMPMPLYTFFDEYDFSGKTIIPFSSHGGSGLARTVNKIKDLEPKAMVKDGYTVSRDDIAADAKSVEKDLASWINNLNIE
ncbi:MAG: flavodoxin [Lachnospirales bacterium]